MDKIIKGVLTFQQKEQPKRQAAFNELAGGQAPEALFITCADSRVDPNLITSTNPGDLFVCRNAGNIVPPHSHQTNGIAASIEYGVSALGIRHIIICGHNECGAMQGVLNPESIEKMPLVKDWLAFSAAAKNVSATDPKEQLKLTVRANVLLQISHLKTHPCVASRLATDEISLHGWVYDIKSGAIEVFDAAQDKFVQFAEFYNKSSHSITHSSVQQAPAPQEGIFEKGVGRQALSAISRPRYAPSATGICAFIRDYVQAEGEVKPSHFLTADLGIAGAQGPNFIEVFRRTFDTDFSAMTMSTYFDCQKTDHSARNKMRKFFRSNKSKAKDFIDLRVAHLIMAVERGAWYDSMVKKRRPASAPAKETKTISNPSPLKNA